MFVIPGRRKRWPESITTIVVWISGSMLRIAPE